MARFFAFAIIAAVIFVLGSEAILQILPPKQILPSDAGAMSFWQNPARAHPWTQTNEVPFKIVLIGDSITAGAGTYMYHRFGSVLEWLMNLNQDSRPAEVDVLANAGTSPTSQRFLFNKALKKNPDIVIFGISLNDVEGKRDDPELARYRNALTPPEPAAVTAWLTNHSTVASWLYDRTETHRLDSVRKEYYDFLFYENFEGRKYFRRAIRHYHQVCEENGVVMTALILPPLSDVYPDPFDIAEYHEKLRTFFDEEGIPYIDLLDIFRRFSTERIELVPGHDSHFNELGHRIVAENLFAWLLAHGLIPEEYTPQHKNFPTLKRIIGYHMPLYRKADK